MAYNYKQEELYGRALFNFDKAGQNIWIAFEYDGDKKYMMIIFCDSGEDIADPHDPAFVQTLNQIVVDFDNDLEFEYEVFAF